MDVTFTVEFDTAATPEQVVAALTDFSDNRPKIWKGLSKGDYEVHSAGANSADVTEGTTSFRAREEYDWSRPNRVSWTCRESNFLVPGTVMEVVATPTPSGSRIVYNFHRNFRGKGLMLVPGVKFGGKKFFGKYFKTTFDNLAK